MVIFKAMQSENVAKAIELMSDFYAIDGYPIDRKKSEVLLQQFIAEPDLGRSWLIEFDNEVIGYVILTFIFSFEYGGKIAFVDELYLMEIARGKGVGTQTIDFILKQADIFNLKLLYLEVEEHNFKAQQLYKSAGFTIHNRQIMKHKLN